ncbi:MAG: CIA30 family protein [Pseudomonadota bacterium]
MLEADIRAWISRFVWACVLGLGGIAMADSMLIDDFSESDGRWRFVTDGVMGGVSTGQVVIDRDTTGAFLHLSGAVSTENRGGFIQARLDLDAPLSGDKTRLRLRVKGDGQIYFIHIRTRATRLPWQYYQAAFSTSGAWQEINLPLADFRPSGSTLPKAPRGETIKSIALVAYGRDHVADVSLERISVD